MNIDEKVSVNRANHEDKLISISIMSPFIILILQYLILFSLEIEGTPIGNQVQLISKVIVGVVYLRSLRIVIRRSLRLFTLSYILVSIILLLNFLIFPQNEIHIKAILFQLVAMCIPSMVYIYSIKDIEIFKSIMVKGSKIVFFIGSTISVLSVLQIIDIGLYSMSLSYYMLLPAITGYYSAARSKQITDKFIFVISTIIILLLGARWPMACLLIYILIEKIQKRQRMTYRKLINFFVIMISSSLILININTIIESIYIRLLNYGIQSRTLLLLMQENISLSRRDQLYSIIIEKILENPLTGIGIAGDRLFIGGYTHNIFLEIISGFGIVIGVPIIFSILYSSYKAIINKNTNVSELSLMWFSLGFLPLIISGTYLTEFKFWIFLGIAFRNFQNKSKRRTNI